MERVFSPSPRTTSNSGFPAGNAPDHQHASPGSLAVLEREGEPTPLAFPEWIYPALDTGMGTDTDLTWRSRWGKGISIPCSLNALKTMK